MEALSSWATIETWLLKKRAIREAALFSVIGRREVVESNDNDVGVEEEEEVDEVEEGMTLIEEGIE